MLSTPRFRGHSAALPSLLLALAVAGAATPRSALAADAPRAVVLVTVDTLRADFVSYAGHDRPTTPYLDRLAAGGAVFERAYAPSSWTSPTMASLFAGVFPVSHGVDSGAFDRQTGDIYRQPVLAGSFETLAERFRDAGYLTIGVPSNRHLEGRLGFGQGFEWYLDEAPFMTAERVNREVRRLMTAAFGDNWRQSWKRRKTFLWIHYFDPHIPYEAHAPWIERYAADFASQAASYPAGLNVPMLEKRFPGRGPELAEKLRPLYESEISYFDEQFRQLAEEMGLSDPGVAVVVTSDHGEELLDHGDFSHGRTLYEEVVRVPLLFHWPDGLEGGRRFAHMASLVDLFPTLLDLGALPHPEGLQGSSLAGLLRGGEMASSRELPFELKPRKRVASAPMIGWTDGRWKLIRERKSGTRPQLFDLAADPGESRDLAAQHRDIARRLELDLKRWLGAAPPPPEDMEEAATGDETLKQQLRALGYVD